ncbi:MAG: AF1514 family protein [Pseudomonadota bacterium]
MLEIHITVDGSEVDFDAARAMALAVAGKEDDEEPMLISWNDRVRGKHSPSCVKCELHGDPGWEVYGRNHGGRLRISINKDDYVFIYS